jgi:molecular chaperone DnaK
LEGIRPAQRGEPQVDVTFDIDANGVLTVAAKDKGTGKEQKITVAGSTQLSKYEIDRMVKDAQSFAEEDKKRREEVSVRNSSDAVAYEVERQIRDLGDKVPFNEKARAEQLISKIREQVKSESTDLADMRRSSSDLQQIGHALSAGASAQSPDGASAKNSSSKASTEDVIDAEFEPTK